MQLRGSMRNPEPRLYGGTMSIDKHSIPDVRSTSASPESSHLQVNVG